MYLCATCHGRKRLKGQTCPICEGSGRQRLKPGGVGAPATPAERLALFIALWAVLAILSAWGITEWMGS